MSGISVRPLTIAPKTIAALSEILVETVAHGGSVSFMHPLDPGSAGERLLAECASRSGARRADRARRL